MTSWHRAMPKNACLTDFIFCQEKDCRCNDKQMLQSNRTVTGQDLFLLALGSSAVEKCQCYIRYLLHTVDRHASVSDETRWYNWDHLGSWKNKWAVADTFAKYRTLSSCGVPMSQEPNLESACLDHGHVKLCSAYVGPMLRLCWSMLGS